MNCPTCHLSLAEPVHFCPRCGWPAGRLTVEVPGSFLGLPRTGEASVPLLLHNDGAGFIEYTVRIADDQPWATLLIAQRESASGPARKASATGARRLPAGGVDNTLLVGAATSEVALGADQVILEIRSSDRGGGAEERRPWSVADNRYRTWQLGVPIRRLGEAELYVSRKLAIFTERQRGVPVEVTNVGGSPTRVWVEGLPPNVHASWEERTARDEGDDVLDVSFHDGPASVGNDVGPRGVAGDSTLVLLLRADDDFEGLSEGVLVRSEGGSSHELMLYGEPSERSASLVKHWTLGIDFGTAKSAVYFTDNWVGVEERRPRPILWPAGPAATDRTETTTRSALMYQEFGDVPLCGHRVLVSAGAEAENELVIESMKTQLRGKAAERTIALPSGTQVTPVELVGQFMRHLLEEVRSSEPFRGQPTVDARIVLTLPIMEDRGAFLAQRENTLRAAQQAGLPVGDMLTPSEPECAALDLMHSLRRGDYTFAGRPYNLQDNEIIMVFDCGAGTTDIAILQVLLADGKFGADQLAAAGYRFGGDAVDDLLLSWLLDQKADELRFGWRGRRAMLYLEGLDQPIPLHAAREECRRLKESLFVAGAPQHAREFHTDLGVFEVGQAHVERLIVPFLESMFTAGIMPDPRLFFTRLDARIDDRLREALWREMRTTARARIRPMEQVLREAGLSRNDIGFLFITGGTGQIRIIPSRLYDFMGRSQRIVAATPEDCTVNVARGASLYYDYRISGVLRCAVDVIGRDPDGGRELFRERACAPGALPGPELERAVRIGPRQAVELALAVTYPDHGPTGDIAAHIVRNPAAEPRQLVIRTEYGSDRTLYWRAAFMDGQVAFTQEPVLQI